MSASAESVTIVPCPQCGRKNRVPSVAGPGTPRCASCSTPLPWTTDAGDDTFVKAVETSTVPVLVDLWAPWCGPCRMMAPVLDRLAARRRTSLQVAKIDTDQEQALAGRFGIRSIPTLILFESGRELARQSGARDPAALDRWLDSMLPH